MHQINWMNMDQVTAVLVGFCQIKLRFQEEKNILGTTFGKSKTTHAAKKSNLIILLVRIVRSRIASTRLIPLY